MNPGTSRGRSGSQPAIINSFPSYDHPSPNPHQNMNGSGKFGGTHSPRESKSSDESSNHGGVNGYAPKDGHGPAHHPYSGRGEHQNGFSNGHASHHHHNYQYNNGGKEQRNGEGNYHGSHNGYQSSNNGYYPSSNYYHHRNGYAGSYRGGQYEGSGGYRGGRGGDYHHSSRFGGRFRKPRPYASNYYYNNGPSSDEGGTNRPSYNQGNVALTSQSVRES